MLGHFYQQINYGDDLAAGWHISSAGTVLHGQYFRFGFSIDQANYTPAHDRLWLSNMSYRVGIQLEQAYKRADLIYKCAVGV